MAEPPDVDPPDEALYRAYSTWELEQLRRAFAAERETGRSATGEARQMPAGYYDARLALIDRLLDQALVCWDCGTPLVHADGAEKPCGHQGPMVLTRAEYHRLKGPTDA